MTAALLGSAALFLTASPLSAQTSAPLITWAQSYGVGSYDLTGQPLNDPYYGSGSDVPSGIAPMPDGGVVVAGQLDLPELNINSYNSPHTGYDATAALVRYGADGTILWQQALRQDNEAPNPGGNQRGVCHVDQVATDASGDIFICGGKGNKDNSAQSPFVAMFSAAGALIWQNGIGSTFYNGYTDPNTGLPAAFGNGSPFPAMSLTADGGVIAGGTEYSPENGGTFHPSIAKFNADGSLAFYHPYGGSVAVEVNAICQSHDGTHYLWLTNVNIYSYGSTGQTTAVLTDNAGNSVAERTFASPQAEIPTAAIATADGGFVIYSTIYLNMTEGTAYDGAVVRKLNADLTPVWEKMLTGFTGGSSLVQTSDGGFLLRETLNKATR